MKRNYTQIVFLATGWGASFGGINVFNYELCNHLAITIDKSTTDLFCVIFSSETTTYSANNPNLKIISVEEKYENFFLFNQICPEINSNDIVIWVGHDVKTGERAATLKEICKRSEVRSKLILIKHMDYESYYSHMSISSETLKEKTDSQKNLFPKADLVFGIGPTLVKSAKNHFDDVPIDKVFMLVPGLEKIEPRQDSDSSFSITMTGRIEDETADIKQQRTIAAAFGRVISQDITIFGHDSKLTFLGADEEESNRLRDIAEKEAKRKVVVNTYPFSSERTKLIQHIRKQNIVAMPSLHEGFGLAGWEAIPAQIPLVLSKNSGLYNLIKINDQNADQYLFCVDIKGGIENQDYHDDDVTHIAQIFIDIAQNKESAKQKSLYLFQLLEKYTWEKTAIDFWSECNKLAINIVEQNINIEPKQIINNAKNNQTESNNSFTQETNQSENKEKNIIPQNLNKEVKIIYEKINFNSENLFFTNEIKDLITKQTDFPTHLCLIGLPLSGKSTLLSYLSKQLNNQNHIAIRLYIPNNLIEMDVINKTTYLINEIKDNIPQNTQIVFIIDDIHHKENFMVAKQIHENNLGIVWSSAKENDLTNLLKDINHKNFFSQYEIYVDICKILNNEDIQHYCSSFLKVKLDEKKLQDFFERLKAIIMSKGEMLIKSIQEISLIIDRLDSNNFEEIQSQIESVVVYKSTIIDYLIPKDPEKLIPLLIAKFLKNPLSEVYNYVFEEFNN